MTALQPAAAKRNVFILSVCMALANSAVTLQVTLGGLVGHILAEDKALATLPVTFVVGGTALTTIPASMLMRRVGRKLGFMLGCLIAITGSLVAATSGTLGNISGLRDQKCEGRARNSAGSNGCSVIGGWPGLVATVPERLSHSPRPKASSKV